VVVAEHGGDLDVAAEPKGAMFCLPRYIDSSAAIIFHELKDEDCLRRLSRDALLRDGTWPHRIRYGVSPGQVGESVGTFTNGRSVFPSARSPGSILFCRSLAARCHQPSHVGGAVRSG
jgi:hypothetical protein